MTCDWTVCGICYNAFNWTYEDFKTCACRQDICESCVKYFYKLNDIWHDDEKEKMEITECNFCTRTEKDKFNPWE